MVSGRTAERALRSLWCHNSWVVGFKKKKDFADLSHETDHLLDSFLPRVVLFV